MRIGFVATVAGLLFVIGAAGAAPNTPTPAPKGKPAASAPKAAGKAKRAVSPPTKRPATKAVRTISPPPDVALPGEEYALYTAALAKLDAGDVEAAKQIAAKGRSAVAIKLINWLWLTRPGNGASFEEIQEFIAHHPEWPAQDTLARRAEQALAASGSDGAVLDWFAGRLPLTGDGELRLAESLLRAGRHEAGLQHLRHAWVEGNFGAKEESEILRRHRGLLRDADHAARLDRLLWDQDRVAAKRMLPRVDADVRALGEARLALGESAGGVERLVARVPRDLQDDAGLTYDRVRWRRVKGMDDLALELLMSAAAKRGDPERWWQERHIQARRLIGNGNYSEAYQLAAAHGMEPGRQFADAEWLAGWIALRFLDERASALEHFTRLYEGVRTPVSRARAAYWAGRAAEAMNDQAAAGRWYADAAQYATAYYGQLAAVRLDRRRPFVLPKDPSPTADEIAAFERSDLVQAARLLAALGQRDRLRTFVVRASDTARSTVEHFMVAELAEALGRVDLGIVAAKRSAQSGFTLVERGYPLVTALTAPELGVEQPLLLALSRQESEFNPEVVSSAGARGLMQLMPATARMAAKNLQIAYRPELLTTDPEYNARLGSHFLSTLLDAYDGNYPLALAAYNAGDARVRRWIRDNGDPRDQNVDVVDWIELIPFGETRNYVQRVLESVQVYRQRLDPKLSMLLQIEEDMRGRSRQRGCDC